MVKEERSLLVSGGGDDPRTTGGVRWCEMRGGEMREGEMRGGEMRWGEMRVMWSRWWPGRERPTVGLRVTKERTRKKSAVGAGRSTVGARQSVAG